MFITGIKEEKKQCKLPKNFQDLSKRSITERADILFKAAIYRRRRFD